MIWTFTMRMRTEDGAACAQRGDDQKCGDGSARYELTATNGARVEHQRLCVNHAARAAAKHGIPFPLGSKP